MKTLSKRWTSALRVGLSTAAFAAAGTAFLPLFTSAGSDAPPVAAEVSAMSLVATWNWDIPGYNCCNVLVYQPGYEYSTPDECKRCHIEPKPWPFSEDGSEGSEFPVIDPDLECTRFE